MRLSRLLPAAAMVAVLGAAAYAERPVVHVAEYQLPGGGVARVRYTGDVAPRLVVVPAGRAVAAPPFAMFDQVAAMMDAQADAMVADLQRAAAAPEPTATAPAALAGAPAGVRWTSVSSTSAGGRTCTTEVSMVSQGDGKAPWTVREVSGDCGGAPAAVAKPDPATVPRDSI